MKTITQSILLLFCVGHFTTQAQGLTPVTFLGTNTTQGSNLNQFNQPQGILTSPSNGHIYVVDGGNDRVSVWTQTGNNFGNLTTFGSQGTAAGNFDNPKGIAQSTDGRLFITDQNNHRICVWSVSGSTFTPVATFGSQGTGANQFDSPSGIVISSNGEIFVCEEGNSRISVWSINGSNYTPVTSFGNGFGSANDQFAVPKDIALGSGGFIYISEFDNNRISVWTQSGNTFGNYAVFGTNQYLSGGSGPNDFSGPSGVAINAGGKIYISDTDNSRICIWTHTGNSFGFLTSIGGVYGAALNEFGYPASIAFGSNGRLFISDNLARVSIWQGCAPPTILTQPASQTLCGGNLATFSFTGSGSGLSYLWSNGATTAGMQTSVAGNYMVTVSGTCGSVISSMANLAVQPTTQITHFPSSQTICGGNTATFDVTAVGANLTYNWYHESDLVNPFATTKMATVSLAGIYSVQVIGSCGTESSFPNNLNTLVVNTATGIAQQPMHQTKCGGSMASFEVTAIGNNLSYIWNNGATTSSMSTSISGSYMVTVSGTCGTVISDIANLIVGTPTQITQHPTAETVCEGILKTTGVTAVGTN
ncbi:MAG: beta-propeller fold lactonase family protein, partial [Bacteroidota bacterium]|nr:beta-propeller fold lactonase family protein [Bacteroidota bacterium]